MTRNPSTEVGPELTPHPVAGRGRRRDMAICSGAFGHPCRRVRMEDDLT